MYLDSKPTGDRLRAAIPVVAVHALLALALLRGLQGQPPEPADDPLSLTPVPPQPVVIELEHPLPPSVTDRAARDPLRQTAPQPEGAASPPNLKAEPTPVVAPEPITRLPIPPPPTVPAAPVAGTGFAPSAGAAPIRGPGTGAGGVGNGRGSGGAGGGSGGGGGGSGDGPIGRLSPPRQIGGELSINDMPEQLRESGFRGRVWVNYRVEADGRVTNCRIEESSGSRQLDQITCRLIERRFRYRPARDTRGTAFPGRIEEYHDFESDYRRRDRRR